MKIQKKITLISSLLFGCVFLISSLIIFTAFYQSSIDIYFRELSRTAQISAMFYLERDELSQKGFQPIQDAFYNLSSDQEVSIFNENGSIAFNTKELEKDWSEKITQIKEKGNLNFREDDTYYHGLFYQDNQGDFVVLVKATNPLIQGQKNRLIGILAISFFIAMTILIVLTSYLSKLAYKPVRDIIKQVNRLNLNKTPLQLSYNSSKDELEELFQAFNSLLSEIETGYEQQKNFVDFSSHELKTPLASIINQLEIALKKERKNSEYQQTSARVLQEAQQLQQILEHLLTLSNLNRKIQYKEKLRIDEIIWQIIEKLSEVYPEEKFQVKLEVLPEDFSALQFKGNETLLYMALFNCIENAAKFSETKPVSIRIFKEKNQLHIEILDHGIGILEKDLKYINQPFFRGNNTSGFQGNGLGMSIALKVFQLHKIEYTITSKPQEFTKIQLQFPQ